MKIYTYFNLQSHSLICHEMFQFYKQQFGWSNFAGIVGVKGGSHYDFLYNQKEINYEFLDTIDSLEKEALHYHIKKEDIIKWEKRLNIPLWHLVIADRNIGHFFVKRGKIPKTKIMDMTNHENISKIVCKYLDFFEDRLDSYNPDLVFLIAIAALPSLALAKVCEYKKIPFYVLRSTRIKNQFILSRNDATERFYNIEKEYNKIIKQKLPHPQFPDELEDYFNSFNSSAPENPIWATTVNNEIAKIKNMSYFKFFFKASIELLRTIFFVIKNLPQKKDLRHKNAFSNYVLEYRRIFTIKTFNTKIFDPFNPEEEKYIYFPLHINPEASTMILAPNFVDQLFVIDLLAKNIPMSHKLYIKEHPLMMGRRTKNFYKTIKKYPNIKLISPSTNTFTIIRNADLITVITGTAGWEALLMEKPVLTFGENFYSHIGLAEQCTDIVNLAKQIKNLLFGTNNNKQNRRNLLRLFLTLIYNNSFEIPVKILWGRTIKPNKLNQMEIKLAHKLAKELVKQYNTDQNYFIK